MMKVLVQRPVPYERMKKILISLGGYFDKHFCFDFLDRELTYLGYAQFINGVSPFLDEFHYVMDADEFERALVSFRRFFADCFPEYKGDIRES